MQNSLAQLFDNAVTGDAPQNIGIGGFKLYASITEEANYETDAPISFLEDGSYTIDHLILKPITLDIFANVSDIFLDTGIATGIEKLVRGVQGELGVVTKYLPASSQATIQRMNSIVASVNDAYDELSILSTEGNQLYDFFGDKTEKSPQKLFFDFLDKIRESRSLINVQTRFRTYKNMAIISVNPSNDNQTYSTSFSMQLQEIRFVETQTIKTSVNTKKAASGVGGDVSSEVDNGSQHGSKPTSSLFSLASSQGLL